jgi:hypothetical protein
MRRHVREAPEKAMPQQWRSRSAYVDRGCLQSAVEFASSAVPYLESEIARVTERKIAKFFSKLAHRHRSFSLVALRLSYPEQFPETAKMKKMNFGRNGQIDSESYFTPKTEAEVLALLNQNKGRSIHCMGRLHSWIRVLDRPTYC